MGHCTKQSEHARAEEAKGKQLASPLGVPTFRKRLAASASGLTRDAFGVSSPTDEATGVLHTVYSGKSRTSVHSDSSCWRENVPHIRKNPGQPGKSMRSARFHQSLADEIGSFAEYDMEEVVAPDTNMLSADYQGASSAPPLATKSRRTSGERLLPMRTVSARSHQTPTHYDTRVFEDHGCLAVSLYSSPKALFDSQMLKPSKHRPRNDLAKPFQPTQNPEQQWISQHESWVADWHDVLDSPSDRTWRQPLSIITTRRNQAGFLQTGHDSLNGRVTDRLTMIHGHLAVNSVLPVESFYAPVIGQANPSQDKLGIPSFHCPWRSCHQVGDPTRCTPTAPSLLTSK